MICYHDSSLFICIVAFFFFSSTSHQINSFTFYFSSMEIFCSQKKTCIFPPYCRMCFDEVSDDDIHCGLLLKVLAAIRLLIHFLHIFGEPVYLRTCVCHWGQCRSTCWALQLCKEKEDLASWIAIALKTTVEKWHNHQRWRHSKSSAESIATMDASNRFIHSTAFPQGMASCKWLH